MKRTLLCLCLFLGSIGVARAGEQTVLLKVPGMFCASCPYVVSRSLKSVKGVVSVRTSLKARTARVVYDDVVTSPKALTEATKDAGYPSSLAKGSPQ